MLDGKHVALRIRVYCGKSLQPAGVLLQSILVKGVLQEASSDPLPSPWAPRGSESVADLFKPFWWVNYSPFRLLRIPRSACGLGGLFTGCSNVFIDKRMVHAHGYPWRSEQVPNNLKSVRPYALVVGLLLMDKTLLCSSRYRKARSVRSEPPRSSPPILDV